MRPSFFQYKKDPLRLTANTANRMGSYTQDPLHWQDITTDSHMMRYPTQTGSEKSTIRSESENNRP